MNVCEVKAMATAPEAEFHCDVKTSSKEQGEQITTVACHGRLVSSHTETLKSTVKPLLGSGKGTVLIDCAGVTFLDSLGLGALVGLKVSALHKPHCSVRLVNVSPRVKELLRLTQLDEFLSY